MRKIAHITLVFIPILVLFVSCTKEYSNEGNRTSSGYLVKDNSGNCTASTVAGIYVVGKKLTDSNFIQVQVHLTRAGNYNVWTDTLNGFLFSASGLFPDTGNIQLKLFGKGNPTAIGASLFTVHYSSSICSTLVQVADSVHIAAYSLQGSPNACMSDSIAGSYIKGILLDTSEKIIVTLNVTSVGNYSISTDTVNGYSFSGSGVLGTPGLQTVSLSASGTPANAGTDVFKIIGKTSSCSFSNTVYTSTVTINPDHFPLTPNSYWNYDDLSNPGDTIGRAIVDTIDENGNTYEIMQENLSAGGLKQYYYRKQGANYYDYAAVDKYTNSVQYSPAVDDDINFLKENINTGDSWYSTQFSGTATFGQVILLQYYFVCKNSNAAVVVDGKAFTNVYIISMQPLIASVGYPLNSTGETYTFYYAKGVGLIYENEANLFYTQPKLQIRNWIVF